MQYFSTRDKTKRVSASRAIVDGIAPDGGLYLPEEIPQISFDEIAAMAKTDYFARAKKVLSLYLTDFTEEELQSCIAGAYGGGKFSDEAIAPVRQICDGEYFLELWHGPTCAFKDMALQLLPRLMVTAAKKTGSKDKIVILVATSGDTGKAALEGFRDLDGIEMIVFYPEDGVSALQKLQMQTQEGENLFVAAVKGNFDDAQTGVKHIFADERIKEELAKQGRVFSSANSINWGRLVPQIVYYFSAYCDLLSRGEISLGDRINICVPTGNFGNILAAFYAGRMGLPLGKLICASNKNNVLADFIETGIFNRNRPFYPTISPSMDILIPSNLERLLFYLLDEDDQAVLQMMQNLAKNGTYTLPEQARTRLWEQFAGGYCSDEDTQAEIGDIFARCGYLCDTHTAVAAAVLRQYRAQSGDQRKTVLASTANPYKFPEAVLQAVGGKTDGLDAFAVTEQLEKVSGMEMPAELAGLRGKPVRFCEVLEKDEMEKALKHLV